MLSTLYETRLRKNGNKQDKKFVSRVEGARQRALACAASGDRPLAEKQATIGRVTWL